MFSLFFFLSIFVVSTVAARDSNGDIISLIKELSNKIDRVESKVDGFRTDMKTEIKQQIEEKMKKKDNSSNLPFEVARSHTERKIQLSHENLLTTFEQMGREFFISFDFVPCSIPQHEEWSNVFHVTDGSGWCCESGQRIPAMWVRRVDGINYLHVNADQSGQLMEYYKPEPSIEIGRSMHIEMSQVKSKTSGQYIFSVKVNGKVVWAFVNPNPKVFDNVKVYTNGHDTTPEGTLWNFKIFSS